MKLFSFLSIVWILFSLPLSAQAQQMTALVLHADDTGEHNAICEFPEGYAAKAELFVWVKPLIGIEGVFFSLDYQDYLIPEDMVINESNVIAYLGDLDSGIEILTTCIAVDSWLVRQTFWIVSNEASWLEIAPHSNPDINQIGYVICGGGMFEFEGTGGLFINMPSDGWACKDPLDLVVGTQESSWGAIKALYK